MAMESFRLSFLNDDQDVNFDAILGELSELETQLTTTQCELSQSLGGGVGYFPRSAPLDGRVEGSAGDDTIQAELDALAAEITQGLSYKTTNGQLHVPVACEQNYDAGEADSAFSDNASLPSSGSFTSMVTVSSSAETTSSSSAETCSMSSTVSTTTVQNEDEHLARLKAEKIRIALEKIKEAKIRKLFVRAFAKDGSSKSILVDEKMTVGQVCCMLADKHHGQLTHDMAVVEHMPELFMERVLEDHDSLVENMVMWTRDSKNKVLFEERPEKYNLFFTPEKYLLPGSSSQKGIELGSTQKERLLQEFFSPAGVSVPEVEGALYLKSDGKKAWKKYFFVLRVSGIYYNPKGKVSKAPKDLVCLVQFEFVEVYNGISWKKKYHSPTDFCFALKHPQIQKKTSKYIRYFCAESETALDQWIMGIRIAKFGKQLLHNFEQVHHEISTWDLRQSSSPSTSSSGQVRWAEGSEQSPDHYQTLNQLSLQDSRLSVPEPSVHHTIVSVHNTGLVRHSAAPASDGSQYNDIVGIEVTPVPHRKGSEGGVELSTGQKTPAKRVSFSTTHCIITDSSEQLVAAKHRDSIVSASTDSSEDSNSSGEGRHIMANTLRGKLRPKLPVTTETTRLLTEMNQLSFDSGSPSGDGYGLDETSSLSSTSSTSSRQHFSRGDRRRSSMTDRRGSDAGSNRATHSRMNGCVGGMPMSPPAGARRHSHEGSPTPTSPHAWHSGTQQWVEECQGGMEAMASVPEPSQAGCYRMEDHYLYSGGLSHQSHQKQQQSFSDLPPHSTISQSAVPADLRAHSAAGDHGCGGLGVPECVSEENVLPPPPQFQENTVALSPPTSHVPLPIAPPPTAPKPSGPPPPPPPSHAGHKQQQPPPVLPKSVPVPHPLASGSTKRGTVSQPTQDSGETTSPGRSKASVSTQQQGPPLAPSGKAGPPTLPKSTMPSSLAQTSSPTTPASSPMSPVNGQTSHRYGRGTSPVSPECFSAPATLTKSASTPSGHYGHGYASSGSPSSLGSPHRVSHIKHPSTGSPMLGMGPSMANNKGPSPSDSGYIEGDGSSCTGSPSILSYASEPPRLLQGPDLGTSSNQSHSQVPETPSTHISASHRRSASAGSAVIRGSNKQDGRMKAPPPPPPKRSDTTRLSTELSRAGPKDTCPPSPSWQPSGQYMQSMQDPIYENCEGILDISELPPPPPELLADLMDTHDNAASAAVAVAVTGKTACQRNTNKKQQRLPPPPPKRSKDTHLSQSQ